MTAATALPPDVAAYLASVRSALRDLPDSERDDLLAEVEASLTEAVHEGGSLPARLGPPEEFAAELRAAAGLHEPAGTTAPEVSLVRQLRDAAARAAANPTLASVRRVGSDLAPIWWVARAFVAVGALAIVLENEWSLRYAFVPRFGSAEAGLALIAATVVVSVAVGVWLRRRDNPFPRVSLVANAALAIAVVPVALAVTDTDAYDALVAQAYAPVPAVAAPGGLSYQGQPVTNVYPFTRDGELLHDVMLYDQDGRPLEVPGNRGLDPDRRFVTTNGNRALFNVFPIRYFEPGTKRVARPNAVPYIEHPFVVTPPLRAP